MEVLRAAGFTLEQATPEMMQTAREKAVRAGVNVDVREGLAQALPFPDDSVDAVVSTLAWHHIPPDAQGTAASEMTRALAGGLATHLLGHRMARCDTVDDALLSA